MGLQFVLTPLLSIYFASGPLPNLILQSFFETAETTRKNAASKRGEIEAANMSISYALLGISSWIGKGNRKDDGFGEIFLCFRDSMQRYYLRITG
jgi:hypothetical protein